MLAVDEIRGKADSTERAFMLAEPATKNWENEPEDAALVVNID
jgi:hypothetical protein